MKYKPEIVTAFFKSEGLPTPIYEYQHIPGRRFRLDLAWPQHKVGVEVCGGIWLPISGHRSGVSIKRDYTKDNLGLMEGWRVIKVEPKELCLVETVNMVKRLIQMQGGTL